VISAMLDFLTFSLCSPYSETTDSDHFDNLLETVACPIEDPPTKIKYIHNLTIKTNPTHSKNSTHLEKLEYNSAITGNCF
jgi:hypothetical protein